MLIYDSVFIIFVTSCIFIIYFNIVEFYDMLVAFRYQKYTGVYQFQTSNASEQLNMGLRVANYLNIA